MSDDEDSIQLSEYCFGVCEVLEMATQGESADDPDGFVWTALEDVETCVD